MMTRREVLVGGAAAVAVGRRARAGDLRVPVVATTAGKVSGYDAGSGIAAFKGVPYGRDTRLTRFAAPMAPLGWKDVRVCTTWGPRAPQVLGARPEYESARAHDALPVHGYHLPPDEGVQREDCLHVNVWTSSLRDGKPSQKGRAVLFYIHGGAYNNGTVNAALYDGTRLVDEEQFGPVLPVIKYSDPEDALARANASPYGLGASVWSSNPARAQALAERMDAGTVWINKHSELAPNIPFGGAKESGIGAEMGEDSINEYTQLQVINAAR